MLYVDVHDARVPALGFGTWQMEGDEARDGVKHALELGYRHIDTAQIYGNEAEVGDGIRSSGISREDIWLTTKVWKARLRHDDVLSSTEESLRKLGTHYVDLLLIHWPKYDIPLEETFSAMGELRQQGKAHYLGVSNFPPSLLEKALEIDSRVITDQVEYHPFLSQDKLLAIVRDRGLFLTAYSPLAQGKVMGDETIGEIARRHGKSTAQVTLRWLLQQDRVVAIPKASSPKHRVSNLEVFDFELSTDEMSRISGLARKDSRLIDIGYVPDWED